MKIFNKRGSQNNYGYFSKVLMKFQFKYINRNNNDDAYVFRLKALKNQRHKSFNDHQYKNSKKSVEDYSKKILRNLSKAEKKILRTGYPKLQKEAGVLLCTRVVKGKRIPMYYLAKAYDKFIGKIVRKSFSFEVIRSQEEAERLAHQWRKKTVKIINAKAKARGFKP